MSKEISPQKALEIIQRKSSIPGNGESFSKDIVPAYDLAEAAIKKMIPLEPEYEADGYDDAGNLAYDTAKCPVCHHEFEYGINDWGCDFCQGCGQALNWESNP